MFTLLLICVLLSSGIGIGIRLAEYCGWGSWLFPPVLGFCCFYLTWPIGKLLGIYTCFPRPSSHGCTSQTCFYHRISREKLFDLLKCDTCGKTFAQLRRTLSIKGIKYRGGEWFIVLDLKSNPTIVVQCSMGTFFPKRFDKICTNAAIIEPLVEYFQQRVTH